MYLKSLTIKQFRCFKTIHLRDLSKLVILIGENDSGKSILLEALRFLFSGSKGAANNSASGSIEGREHLWFGAKTEVPIIFSAVIGLEDEDRKELQKRTKPHPFVKEGDLVVSLELINKGGTIYKRWQGIEGKGLPPISLIEKEGSERFEFKTKDGRSEKIVISGNTINAISIAQGVEHLFKDKFKLIPATRERPFEERSIDGLDGREFFLPSKTESKIKAKGEDILVPKKRREWTDYCNRMKEIVGNMDVKAKDIIFDREIQGESTLIPVNLIGGGLQMYLYLLDEVEDATADIIALEEPENHFHPKLIKHLIKKLEKFAEQGKQFFITSHSPFVIDSSLLSNIWFVGQEEGVSEIKRITEKEEYSKLLLQIGVMPSDFLLSNAIFLVEGESDQIFLTEIARKLGKDFKEAWITIIPVKGASKAKPHYQFWAEITKHAPLPKFALLDKNAENERTRLIDAGMKKENISVLQKGDIEDYYPRPLVVEFVKDETGKEINENDISVGQTVKKLRDYFDKKDWWKKPLAQRISERISPDQIDYELDQIISQVYRREKKNFTPKLHF
jgi:AAA15 family ATPase/GTPase